jgi:8-oxo-dGDP phosphatase
VGFRSGRVFDVRTDEVTMPDGSTATRDVVVHPGAVGIIALDSAGQVLLLQQYRHPVGRLLWEPPAGLLDEPGEDPLVAAKRELYEEAHLQAERWEVLLDVFTSPGMSDEAVRIYLARDVSPATAPRFAGQHEEANLPTKWVPLDQAVRAAQRGALHNPLAVMGVLAASAAAQEAFAGLRPADAPWPEASAFTGSAHEPPAG